MRKNRDYVPTKIQITHVREVLQLMSVLTKDNRFEEAYQEFEEGEEVKFMSEVLDRMISKGRQEGKLEILLGLVKDGILTIAEAAKRADMTEAVFTEKMNQFKA